MRIATFNVNGVNGRLPVLRTWRSTAPSPVTIWSRSAADIPVRPPVVAMIFRPGQRSRAALMLSTPSRSGISISSMTRLSSPMAP